MTLLIALLPMLALAAPGDGPCEHGDRSPPHELILESADALGLDDEAVAAIQTIADEARPELEALRASMQDASGAERDALRRDMHEAGRAVMDDIMAQLTEPQREQAMALLPPPPGGPEGPDSADR